MISYGSQPSCTEMSNVCRSHQLGEGQAIGAEMPSEICPSRLVYGSQSHGTAMSHLVRSHQLGEGQTMHAEMPMPNCPSRLVYGSQILIAETLCGKRSHQLGKGHVTITEMSQERHPSRLVLESQGSNAEMPMRDRSQGKGQPSIAEMPVETRPSPPVYGSRNHNAAMPMEKRSHLFTRGQTPVAEMLFENRLSRGGSANLHRNVMRRSPFPTSLREPMVVRSNAHVLSLPLIHERSNIIRRNAKDHTPLKGRVNPTLQQCQNRHTLPHQFWATYRSQQCHLTNAQF